MAQSDDPILTGLKILGGAFLAALAGAATAKAFTPNPTPRRLGTWQATERGVCKAIGQAHHGGPGKPDCGTTTEVKDWSTPVHAGVIRAEARKGRRTIWANDFTAPARKEARRLGVKLRYLG